MAVYLIQITGVILTEDDYDSPDGWPIEAVFEKLQRHDSVTDVSAVLMQPTKPAADTEET